MARAITNPRPLLGVGSRVARGVEAAEELGQIFGWNADTSIFYKQADPLRMEFSSQADAPTRGM